MVSATLITGCEKLGEASGTGKGHIKLVTLIPLIILLTVLPFST